MAGRDPAIPRSIALDAMAGSSPATTVKCEGGSEPNRLIQATLRHNCR
jgi:hypothetical protein